MWHFRRARTALLARFKGIVLSLTSSSLLGFLVPFVPNAPRSTVYALPYHPPDPACATDGLPLPPPALWLGYAATAEYYVRSGAAHMEQLLELAREAGWTPQAGSRILDFGCGAGRMTRALHCYAETCEIWGVDVRADHIAWCDEHLTPPFHFVTTTMLPHLPFEDGWFDFIYAGSVFTHIDDLADMWLLELRRITKPGSILCLSFIDESGLRELDAPRWKDFWLKKYLDSSAAYQQLVQKPFTKLVIGRALQAEVFYNSQALRRKLGRWFELVALSQHAHEFQSVAVLRKPALPPAKENEAHR